MKLNNIKLKLCVLLFVFLVVNLALAQNFEREFIYLKSRTISLDKNTSIQTLNEINNLQDKKHFILTFKDINKNITLLNLNNIELLTYIPHNGWFVSISNRDIVNKFDQLNIKSIHNILPDDKLSPSIKNDKMGAWSINNDGDVIVLVKFFKDVSLEDARHIIKKLGYKIYDEINTVNVLTVALPQEEIYLLAKKDSIQWIEEILPPSEDTLDQSTEKIGVDVIQTNPYNLDGTNVFILQYETNVPYEHDDLKDRILYPEEEGCSVSPHATSVAGIMGGDGTKNESLRGIATKAVIVAYEHDYDTVHFHNTTGQIEEEYNISINTYSVSLSSNSWGTPALYYKDHCEWLGDYTIVSELLDNITTGSLGNKMTLVWANGNGRSNFVDCGDFNTTIPRAASKNVISVGGIHSNDDSIVNLSSWGPTDDGRIKPDLVAPSCQRDEDKGVTSTNIYNSYSTNIACGTSFAAPHVSGIAALMYQQFRCLQPYDVSTPLPSTIKALLIHTAKDLNNTGPDYITGWGKVNATSSVDHIIYRYFREENLSSVTAVDIFNFTINDSLAPIKVTLVWDDYPGTLNSNKTLINDLDLFLIAPNGSVYKSWTLNSSNPSASATKDGDNINNVEQVYVGSPGSDNLYDDGNWQIIVNSTSCAHCPQKYSIVYKRPFEIKLYKGWNLISIPIKPYNITPEFVFKNINYTINSAWTYDPDNCLDDWCVWVPGGAPDDLDEVKPGLGYWISVNDSVSLEINGDPIMKNSDSSSPLTKPSSAYSDDNWTLIGFDSFFKIFVLEALDSLNFTSVFKFKQGSPEIGNDNWIIYYNNETFENVDFNLEPGIGTWIQAKPANWTLSHNRSCSSLFFQDNFTIEESGAPGEGDDSFKLGAKSREQAFIIYGYAACDQLLNRTHDNTTIHIKINGSEVNNYTMGMLPIDQFRLQVPMGGDGGASENDSAQIFINNNVSISEGNVTIGGSGEFYYFNITGVNTTDSDGDNFSAECLDCDDNNASIHPNAMEICYDGHDNDCDGFVDEGCNVTITSFNEDLYVDINTKTVIFEAVVETDLETDNLTDINWSFDTGENKIYANHLFNLVHGESISLLIEHTYNNYGTKNYNFTVFTEARSDAVTGSIDLKTVNVTDLSAVHSEDDIRVFEFIISNLLNSNSSVNWTLDTGESNISNNYKIDLTAQEDVPVIVEYDYSSYDDFTVQATVNDNLTNDSMSISVSVKELLITGFSKLFSNSTLAVFEFIINNLWSTNKTFSWSFDTNDTAGVIWSDNTITLTQEENVSILFEHNFSSTGNYEVSAKANTTVANYSESLNMSLS
ncbi:hypothetical protein AYK26_01735 [Euryarchaeota archaeon SM23-78]|nr:MAG: hypothetical protein AYK26_01735 [Euryarchaeota archaeon SM23-78]MBW3000847.1 S8 family serine peptidase [Candidatus Woesearchaeota archaeon]